MSGWMPALIRLNNNYITGLWRDCCGYFSKTSVLQHGAIIFCIMRSRDIYTTRKNCSSYIGCTVMCGSRLCMAFNPVTRRSDIPSHY